MLQEHNMVLSLDLGTSSVGWALFRSDEEGLPCALVDMGVRHFEEVVEPKTGELKNAKRQAARSMRRNLQRRRRRRLKLLHALQSAGLANEVATPFAESEAEPHKPYEIRARAVVESVSLDELGRALYHLGRKRGFKSNRGAKLATVNNDPEVRSLLASLAQAQESEDKPGDDEKEEGKVLAEISGLRLEMGDMTLGQFFWSQIQQGLRVRGRHTDRSMYEEEFERIWSVQATYHPELLTNELRARIYDAIFFQRPLKRQKFLKGMCSLEPTKVRAERAQLIAQRFRYWQDLANLLLTDQSSGERRCLTPQEKQHLAELLETRRSLTWTAVRKELRLGRGWDFNLERAKGGELKGNGTASAISKRAKEFWKSATEIEREQLVEILLTVEDRGALYRTLREKIGLAKEVAYSLAILDLESGTASLSSKAMKRILVGMQQGLSRSDAQIKANYKPWEEERQVLSRLGSLPSRLDITSPRVRKGVGQVRKVVNALIATYGKPTIIRIEMARDLSLTKKEREGKEKANKALAAENRRAEDWFIAQGVVNPSRTDRIWFRLAEQCKWRCPYSGKPIPQELTSMGLFQIEHIVPYIRSLDDSFNNLTLCEAELNRKKGNRTPWEAFGASSDWEEMVSRSMDWKGFGTNHKRRLFLQQEMPDEEKMTSRQLNETRWICRSVAKFVEPVCERVELTKGQATAMLREHWGLMSTLYEDGKKSRDDLRHHAVDAVAIAFTSRALFQRITAHRKRAVQGGFEDLKVAPLSNQTVPPAPGWLHEAVKRRLATLVVSHELKHAIENAFHEETAMGLRDPKNGLYHLRKPLVDMKEGMLANIVDSSLREAALAKFIANGKNAKVAFEGGLQLGKTVAYRARFTKRIKNARLLSVPSDSPQKHFEQGNNHHVELFENSETNKRIGRFVTALDAANRARRVSKEIVDRDGPNAAWRFVMWLAPNDIVRIPDDPRELFYVQKLDAANEVIVLRTISAAMVNDDAQRLFKTPNTFRGTKLLVDPIGRVREIAEGVV